MITHEIFQSAIQTLQRCDPIIQVIDTAAEQMICALGNGNKILVCGNGGSAADAQHFSAELLCRFETERRALPALALSTDTSTLTAIGNDYSFDEIFSRQVQAHGVMDDVLLVFTTSGNSPNIIRAVEAALDRGMVVIAVTGKNGGQLVSFYGDSITSIIVPSDSTARIQEVHQVIIHCLCYKLDSIDWDSI